MTAHDDFFVLGFHTECSTSPTLDDFAGPHGYRTWDPTNPDDPYNAPTETETDADTNTE
ncbi:hypothetical protein [Leifsonia xyli]|uniref:hypothetical protein n=1 Tax=Leifsonia xyli TaxID=1575 RepID=UPI000425CF8B|nr:hypothetical protein [Leifsonia xyli]